MTDDRVVTAVLRDQDSVLAEVKVTRFPSLCTIAIVDHDSLTSQAITNDDAEALRWLDRYA
jgi:hypothetical protein